MNDDELDWMFKDIEKRYGQLSEWEQNFIGDIENKFRSGLPLSKKQIAKLSDIYEKVTENG